MLLYLFLIFHVFNSASCTITCYNCPIELNNFDYLITVDNLPADLSNCSTINIGDICLIDIIWSRNSDKTQIGFTGRGDERSADIEHSVYTNINLEKKETGYIWSKSMSYTCSTDNCNSRSALQQLLASLTLYDNFDDVKDLLRTEEPFVGSGCRLETNMTSGECNQDMDLLSCQECSFQGTSNQGPVEYCSNCLTTDIGEIFMTHEADFNIIDRTRADHWTLVCRFPDCNTNTYGSQVRASVKSDFDFAKFLNNASQTTRSSFMLEIIVLSLLTLMKLFY